MPGGEAWHLCGHTTATLDTSVHIRMLKHHVSCVVTHGVFYLDSWLTLCLGVA